MVRGRTAILSLSTACVGQSPRWTAEQEQQRGGSAVLNPTDLNLQRLDIRPGHWGQWLAIGAVGLVGFVVLALLLVFEPAISQLDHQLLGRVISLRTPELTLFASAVTRLGSASL